MNMKKQISLFAILFTISFTFISCSMFEKNAYDENASVSFAIPSELLARAINSDVRDSKTTLNKNFDGVKNQQYLLIKVSLSGDYSETQTGKIELENADPENLDYDSMEPQNFIFNNIPVGSSVKADLIVYFVNSSPDDNFEQKIPLLKASSETITIKKGENVLKLKATDMYKNFPVTITIDFEGSGINDDYYDINVFAFKPDSKYLKEFYNLTTSQTFDYNTDYYKFMNLVNTEDCAGYGSWTYYGANFGEPPSQPVEIDSENPNHWTLSGEMSLLTDEKLVFVAVAFFGDAKFSGYTSVSSFNGLLNTASLPKEKSNSVSMKLSKFVPESSQYVYYDIDESLYKIYSQYEFQKGTSEGFTLFSEGNSTNKMTFDSDSNIYLLNNISGQCKIIKHTQSNQNSTYTVNSVPELSSISIDMKTDELYGIYSDDTIYKLTLNGTVLESENVTPENFFENTDGTVDCFAVNNGIIYIPSVFFDAGTSEYGLNFIVASISTGTVISKTLSLNSNEVVLNSNSQITDVLYRGGYVYILLREVAVESEPNFITSRGAVIKVNVSDYSCIARGFAPKTSLTSFKAAVQYYYSDSQAYLTFFNTEDPDLKDYYGATFSGAEYEVVINLPFNKKNSYFVGPEKFIAVKPKKLVISDTGLFMYTTSNGLLAKKKMNRVVEIDLETLSMSNAVMTEIPKEFSNRYPQANLVMSKTTGEVQGLPTYNFASGDWWHITLPDQVELIPFILEE